MRKRRTKKMRIGWRRKRGAEKGQMELGRHRRMRSRPETSWIV